jgi:hypothetical protein
MAEGIISMAFTGAGIWVGSEIRYDAGWFFQICLFQKLDLPGSVHPLRMNGCICLETLGLRLRGPSTLGGLLISPHRVVNRTRE